MKIALAHLSVEAFAHHQRPCAYELEQIDRPPYYQKLAVDSTQKKNLITVFYFLQVVHVLTTQTSASD